MLARVVALALVAGQASALTLNPLRLFKRGASEHDLSEKLGLEDHAAVSCAIQNFMLARDDGVGSKWMTGALAAPEMATCVGAPDGEAHGRHLVRLPGQGPRRRRQVALARRRSTASWCA
ncbi:hypothetical protein JL720_8049 [Aureococcus anophagefferens]|nr:hypothetical protein JL720_8049 [Aureococcus anophagefferens]